MCTSRLYICSAIGIDGNQKPNKMSNEITIQLTKELYESPMRERNLDKYGHASNQCICCGKPMSEKDLLEGYFVHMNTDWVAVNPQVVTDDNIIELTGAESQGCFPIGNDCAKKMKGFAYKPYSNK